MSSSLKTVATSIVSLMQGISYFAPSTGTTVKYVSDPKQVLNFSIYQTPFCIVAPAGESVQGQNQNLNGSTFETMQYWEMYLGSASFSLEGEAFGGGAVGTDPGIDQMIDDAIAACLGYVVSTTPTSVSKMFPGNPFHRRFDLSAQAVIWQLNWRNQWIRRGV